MIKFIYILFAVLFISSTLAAQPMPKVEREFRAAWIATVDNIDFPSKRTLTVEQQKAELIASLDLAKRLRLNAVIFQVRPMADALYRSDIEPWSEFLTGEMGKPQNFDPLAFIIAEGHKRGILVHAWLNPYRAYHSSAKTVSPDHISKRRPDLVRQYGKYLWLDPTDEEVQRYSLSVILDVVKRYDVDGVHFDDYFYPYVEQDEAGKDIPFPDDKNWEKYLQASKTSMTTPLSRSSWRRMHVNNFIETVGREVKKTKPRVMYGISPFGIWKPLIEQGIKGTDAYEVLYADSRKWLQDGTVDYFVPQLYWETARREQSFPILLNWWREQNTLNRHVWPGLAAYRIGRNANFTATEITDQIALSRKSSQTSGAVFFSFKSLSKDLGGIQDQLLTKVYQHDAIIPPSPWIKSTKPRQPKVSIKKTGKFVKASWQNRGRNDVFWFVVYAKDSSGWSHTVLPASQRSITLSADRKIESVIVEAVDRLGNSSF